MGIVTGFVFTSDNETVTRTKLNSLVANLLTEFNGNIDNANVKAAAGIVYTKLNLSNSVVNADINSSAAIAYSKLNLGLSVVNADISATAAIDNSKLNLTSVTQTVGLSTSTVSDLSATTADINGGTIDGSVIGSSSHASGKFTTLEATTSLKLASGATITGIADEDDMASDSATLSATQQSIKAYADTKLKQFDSWASGTFGSSTQATKDGFLVVHFEIGGSWTLNDYVSIKTDSSNPPATVRAKTTCAGDGYENYGSLFCPVKAGDYYLIEDNGAGFQNETVYFIPLTN